ncbi:hypothetical protein [Qipengyuania nanhaisediminis]|uniref:hypothetical protein n=1 Tax=Qipengyuania nanhaisediminis TaxID=604088 RepID=UPI0038B3F058
MAAPAAPSAPQVTTARQDGGETPTPDRLTLDRNLAGTQRLDRGAIAPDPRGPGPLHERAERRGETEFGPIRPEQAATGPAKNASETASAAPARLAGDLHTASAPQATNAPSSQAHASAAPPPAAPAIAASAPGIATTGAAQPSIGETSGDLRGSTPLGEAIDRLVEAREAGRAGRSELTLRHREFGAINLRMDNAGNDLRAVITNRDPAFVPAVHAALENRAVVAASEPGSAGTQRGSDGAGSQSSTQQQSTGSGNFAGQGGGAMSEGRYGSSPGSGQASSQPYREQDGSRDEEQSASGGHDRDDTGGRTPRGGGVFA